MLGRERFRGGEGRGLGNGLEGLRIDTPTVRPNGFGSGLPESRSPITRKPETPNPEIPSLLLLAHQDKTSSWPCVHNSHQFAIATANPQPAYA